MHRSAALVRALYQHIAAASGAETARFEQWRAHWEHIHGPPGRKRAVDTARLAAPYALAGDIDIPSLLYAVEACFVLRMRVLASTALAAPFATSSLALQQVYEATARLFSREHFVTLGIANYDADLFDITELPLDIASLDLIRAELEAAHGIATTAPGDALRDAYHRLFPKQVRHALGAYFTPPWLAVYIVETIRDWLPAPSTPRMIDPACGAGTFLLAALAALAPETPSNNMTTEALRAALGAVVGLDINPVAIHAAKTNLLLWAARQVPPNALYPPLELPVFLHDALVPHAPPPGSLALEYSPPALTAPFDAVIGNPPWVNWEYLPPAERARTQHLWAELGLFDLRGAQKAFSKEDVAGLFTFAAARRFLADGGVLGFVLPQSLFKSSLNGRGFRRMRLGASGAPLAVLRVDDLVAVRPFAGVAGRPAVLFVRKGLASGSSVPYRRWQLAGPRRAIPEHWAWPAVRAAVSLSEGHAAPGDPADPASPWTDAAPQAAPLLARISGRCAYRARAGMFSGGANGVYYVHLIEELPGGALRVRNLAAGARRSVPEVEAILEPDFVFPLLRGREVAQWRAAGSSLVICPHTAESRMEAVPPEEFKARAPRTFAYLEQFHQTLGERRGFVGWERRFQEAAFYACQRIGAYTFAPYKLVWRYIAREFRCAVIGPGTVGTQAGKPVIPHEKLMLIPFDDPDEAFFVCAVLSSTPARLFIHSRMVETQIAPSVIANLAVPRYNPSDDRHRALAAACRAGHALGHADDRAALHAQLDALMPGVLPLSAAEVRALAAITL